VITAFKILILNFTSAFKILITAFKILILNFTGNKKVVATKYWQQNIGNKILAKLFW